MYLKFKATERRTEKERESFYELVYSPNGHSGCSLSGMKLGAGTPSWICTQLAGAQALGPPNTVFQIHE